MQAMSYSPSILKTQLGKMCANNFVSIALDTPYASMESHHPKRLETTHEYYASYRTLSWHSPISAWTRAVINLPFIRIYLKWGPLLRHLLGRELLEVQRFRSQPRGQGLFRNLLRTLAR